MKKEEKDQETERVVTLSGSDEQPDRALWRNERRQFALKIIEGSSSKTCCLVGKNCCGGKKSTQGASSRSEAGELRQLSWSKGRIRHRLCAFEAGKTSPTLCVQGRQARRRYCMSGAGNHPRRPKPN